MKKIVLLGYGNVGSHLLTAFFDHPTLKVVQVYNRSFVQIPETFSSIPFTQNLEDLQEADVYILSVSDDSIAPFSEKLPFKNKLVVHTSGGANMTAISNKNRRGVFYPLQTFSKNQQVDFKNIPLCIEAENAADEEILMEIANSISDKAVKINSEQRAKIHVAAVFVNNFTNYLYQIGEEILEENDIPFEILIPLIQETGRKIETLNPALAQTGPAKRNDQKTIEKHLNLLQNKSHRSLYSMLTKQISEYHHLKKNDFI